MELIFDDPLWVQAWATVGLFFGALFAGVIAYRVWRLEHRRDVQRERDALGTQAQLVSAWVEWRQPEEAGVRTVLAARWGYVVAVRNASQLPVRYVAVVSLVLAGAHDFESHPTPDARLSVLPPDETRDVAIPSEVVDRWKELGTADWDLLPVIAFTDAAGRDWLRDEHGRLLMPSEPRVPWRARFRRWRARRALGND